MLHSTLLSSYLIIVRFCFIAPDFDISTISYMYSHFQCRWFRYLRIRLYSSEHL